MNVWTAPTSALNLGVGMKAAAVVLTLVIGLSFTLANAEASGDEYGDSATSTGEISGSLSNVTDGVEDTFIQIGTTDGGGSVTVEFSDNVAFDGDGDDLTIHTVDALFPAVATIEVTADGSTWVVVGDHDDTSDINIDLNSLGLPFATAVRITHVSAEQLPGFDLDEVEALNQIDLETVVLSLEPSDAENVVHTEHAVTANVNDGAPAVGVLVSFDIISGPNDDESDVIATGGDEPGDASFAWVGDGGYGLDEIEAWLDINGNGTRDEGEPFAEAAKEWTPFTGTIELTDLDGGGLVVGDVVHVVVEDPDLDTSDALDTIEVLVASASDPLGITIELIETGSHTGIFSGLVELGDTSDEGTGVLAATAGDDVTGTYDDELDADGNDPGPVTASLTVGDTEEAGTKVTVCHRPPGNPGNQKTLTVGSDALDAHLGHGDAVGECGESEVLTKHEQAMERKAERDEQHAEDRAHREADHEADSIQRETDRAERAAERDGARLQREADRAERAGGRDSDRADRDDAFCERKGGDHPRCED